MRCRSLNLLKHKNLIFINANIYYHILTTVKNALGQWDTNITNIMDWLAKSLPNYSSLKNCKLLSKRSMINQYIIDI